MTAPQQQKLRVTGPVVVTANRLGDGAVVYRAKDNGWARRLEDAIVVRTQEEATRLLAAAAGDFRHAVGAYVAPVAFDGPVIKPGNLREFIRSFGPTVALPTDMKA